MKRSGINRQQHAAVVAAGVALSLFAFTLSGARALESVTVADRDLQATVAPVVDRYLAGLHGSGSSERPPSVELADLAPGNRASCLVLAEKALAMYPDHLVKAFARTVALADNIRAWGVDVGGVQGPQIIVVKCRLANLPIVAQTVHAEMAGKVLDLAPPDWGSWRKDNPANFTYGDPTPYMEALAKPDAALTDQSLNAAGFVGRIGLSDQEADFQTYAEQVFLDGPAFAATVRANPAMRNKLRLLLDCYLFVAPDLRPYFERTGLLAASEGAGR